MTHKDITETLATKNNDTVKAVALIPDALMLKGNDLICNSKHNINGENFKGSTTKSNAHGKSILYVIKNLN